MFLSNRFETKRAKIFISLLSLDMSLYNQKYECSFTDGVVEEKSRIKVPGQPSVRHCIRTCATMKEKNENINGVIVGKDATNECWCSLGKSKNTKSSSLYKACVFKLKGKLLVHYI